MNNIIKELSEIENRSEAILDGAAARKRELTREYDEASRRFDEELEAGTEARITELQKEQEASMQERLEKQEAIAKRVIAGLEEHYEANHAKYVDELFRKMTEV